LEINKYSDFPIISIERAIKRKMKHMYFIDCYLFGKNITKQSKDSVKFLRYASYEKISFFERAKYKTNYLEIFGFWMYKYYHYNSNMFNKLKLKEYSCFSQSGNLLYKGDYIKIKYTLVNNWYLFDFINFCLSEIGLDTVNYKFDIEKRRILIYDIIVIKNKGVFSLINNEFRKIIYSLNTSRVVFARSAR
jgi:hypothetical protein